MYGNVLLVVLLLVLLVFWLLLLVLLIVLLVVLILVVTGASVCVLGIGYCVGGDAHSTTHSHTKLLDITR